MARLIDADALKAKAMSGGEGTIASYVRYVLAACIDNDAPTIDAIPIDWLERRLNETAEATARGDDQVELNNAIFQVLVEWEKERRKNGEA